MLILKVCLIVENGSPGFGTSFIKCPIKECKPVAFYISRNGKAPNALSVNKASHFEGNKARNEFDARNSSFVVLYVQEYIISGYQIKN